jgi:glucose/mannose-6-phosphate isomerase
MVLDDPAATVRLDRNDMLGLVGHLGPMLLKGWQAAAGLRLSRLRPAAIVAAGLGGSGIGGDVLRALLAPVATVPVLPVKDDRLPAFVGPQTLVCVCSYSGNTHEALAMFDAARSAGASVVAITSGGTLADRARAAGEPLITVPPALPPRAALPYSLAPMLRAVAAAGAQGPGEDDIREAAGVLDDLAGRRGPSVPASQNPAKQLAVRIAGATPMIYAASSLMAPAAMRWKAQCNENAKCHAVWGAFPDLAHNEVVAWAGDATAASGRFVVILRDAEDGPLAAGQVAAARELAFGRAAGLEEVWPEGRSRLARLLSVIQLGDYVSVYLALLAGVDPTPVEAITAMKARMQEASPPRGTH